MANKITVILPDQPDVKAKIISQSVQGPRGPKGEPGDNIQESKTFTYDSNGELLTVLEGDTLYTYEYDSNGEINTISTPEFTKTFVYDSNGDISHIEVDYV